VGYGRKYGQSYGLDEGPAPTGGVAYSFSRNETVTAVDGVSALHGVGYSYQRDEVVTAIDGTIVVEANGYQFRSDEVVTAVDAVYLSPWDYHYRSDEVVTALDGASATPVLGAEDLPTSPTPSKRRKYEPVVDLNMVQATLTNRGRFYVARGIHDGTIVQPVRYVLGAGWENPRWGESPLPSPDSTEVAHAQFEGTPVLEEANASTLAIRVLGEEGADYEPTEVMVYARILNSPYPDEAHREIPFACATFPPWFHTPNQVFSSRLVIPLGVGARAESVVIPHKVAREVVTAVDTVTVVGPFAKGRRGDDTVIAVDSVAVAVNYERRRDEVVTAVDTVVKT